MAEANSAAAQSTNKGAVNTAPKVVEKVVEPRELLTEGQKYKGAPLFNGGCTRNKVICNKIKFSKDNKVNKGDVFVIAKGVEPFMTLTGLRIENDNLKGLAISIGVRMPRVNGVGSIKEVKDAIVASYPLDNGVGKDVLPLALYNERLLSLLDFGKMDGGATGVDIIATIEGVPSEDGLVVFKAELSEI